MRVIGVLAFLAVVAAIIYGIVLVKNLAASRRRKRIDVVLEDLREIAWQNRDVAPEFSTIMIDEINQQKEKNR